MSLQGPVARDVALDLTAALASRRLCETDARQGHEIMARLQRPLRLAVMGFEHSGKTALVNLLAGSEVFPASHGLPTTLLTYGETASATCTYADGTVKTVASADLRAFAAEDPIYVVLSLPLPALRKVSMLEVVASNDMAEQQRALSWALKRIDMVLWSTRFGTAQEAQIWDLLPEQVADHSYLVCAQEKGVTPQALETAQACFRDVLPVDATAARNAQHSDGKIDKQAFHASGASALVSAVLREADTANRAAVFAAEVFLEKGGVADILAVTATPLPLGQSLGSDVSNAQLTPEARAVCDEVLTRLTAQTDALARDLEQQVSTPQAIMDAALNTVADLAEHLDTCDAANDPAVARWCIKALDAADLMQLIKLEKGEDVAGEALAVMTRLRQEIGTEQAA